jgi:predicted polyphosphate/ATP-dependent NAD kinase
MKHIGFLINPVAGMGGAVGLKGTDGKVEEARRRGARPFANNRARITLSHLPHDKSLDFSTCSGTMGEDTLRETGILEYQVLYFFKGESSAQDTRQAAQMFLRC